MKKVISGHLMSVFAFVVFALVASASAGEDQAKYVFLFIGDGMATVQRAAAEYYLGALEGKSDNQVPTKKLVMNTFPAQGMTSTYSFDAVITDSAASATALACGKKTRSGVIGMDAGKTEKYKTIAEMAKDSGMKVGIVSSVSIDHATPACFYAHEPSRGNYYNISKQLVESNFDYFGGGQMKGNMPKKRKDNKELLAYAREKGWTIATNREELDSAKTGQKLIAFTKVDGDAALNYAMDRKNDEVSLEEFTRKGIELLKDNPKGFFMMVESGKIDWACHANDAAAAIQDTIAFDNSIKIALDFYKTRPNETLIVVTGDHECGGMTIGFAGTKYKNFPQKVTKQKMSFQAFDKIIAQWKKNGTTFEKALPQITEIFGFDKLSDAEMSELKKAYALSMQGEKERAKNDMTYLEYGDYEPLSVKCTHLLNNQAGLSWTSYSHTGVPVTTSAIGMGSDKFNGYFDNTEIFTKIKDSMGL